jgi:alkylated DNA nucleotide flippase Atl1
LPKKLPRPSLLDQPNTRVRDYADVYTLAGGRLLAFRTVREALLATAAHRATQVHRLCEAIGNIASLRSRTFEAHRASLMEAGLDLPADFVAVVNAVTAFADPLTSDSRHTTWQPTDSRRS